MSSRLERHGIGLVRVIRPKPEATTDKADATDGAEAHHDAGSPAAFSAGATPVSGNDRGHGVSDPDTDRRQILFADDADRAKHFQMLVLPHLDDAYNLARWLMREPQDAEDAVQDAYLRAYRSFDTFRGANPRAWILTIVRNVCRTSLQSRRLHETMPLMPDDEDGADPGAGAVADPVELDPEAALARKTEDQALRRLIAALPLAYRETLILREMEELSYQEIADATATPIGTVMSRLARARRLLQKAWMTRHGEDRKG